MPRDFLETSRRYLLKKQGPRAMRQRFMLQALAIGILVWWAAIVVAWELAR